MLKKSAFFIFFSAILLVSWNSRVFAFWMWTPESNQWVNPKYDVKDSPPKQLEYAEGFYEAKDYKKAIAEFEKLIKHYPRAREAPEAQYHVGLCLEEQDKPYDAFRAYQKVIEKYPFSERTADVVERQYKIGERLLEEGNQRNKVISAVIGEGYAVVDVFRHVIKNAPYGKYAAPSQYKIGLYLNEKGLYQEARDEFEKVINDYPDSEWVKAAQYQIAVADAKRSTKSQYDQGVTKAAVAEFEDFVKTYPDAELSKKAQQQVAQLRNKEAENNFLIARFYEKQKNYSAARIYYTTIVEDYGDSPWAGKAQEKLAALGSKVP